jgi:hypothetical protein
MVVCSCLVGFAVEVTHGIYDPAALSLLTAAIAVSVGGILIPPMGIVSRLPTRAVPVLVGALIAAQVITIAMNNSIYHEVSSGASLAGALALAQGLDLKRWRLPVFALTALAFVVVASRAFWLNWRDPNVDVFFFQQTGAGALLDGQNPYRLRYPNVYPYGTPFYGREVVDRNNHLLFGFPYPPLSLVLVLPGYLIGGDVRFVDAVAVAGSALLMVAARPGRWSGLVASLFLLTPRVFFVIERSWTESLVALMFSLVMFCALRFPRALPYALGLFFAAKQYTILVVPLVWLLTSGPDPWRQLRTMVTKAVLVALAINLPFVLWDPVEYFRSVVQFQFMQPFRNDALSYLVWIRHQFPRFRVRVWTPLVGVLPAIPLTLWRCPRSPAGFAAATTIVYLLFFAFNKQAFSNYYFFEIGTACWAAVAAARTISVESVPQGRGAEPVYAVSMTS